MWWYQPQQSRYGFAMKISYVFSMKDGVALKSAAARSLLFVAILTRVDARVETGGWLAKRIDWMP